MKLDEGQAQPSALTELRQSTPARIALGRSGVSLPTTAVLDFAWAHAQARDAIQTPLDVAALRMQLESDGWPVIEVESRAPDRAAYLARPDWGRRLSADTASRLMAARRPDAEAPDLVIVVSDGLSSIAAQRHAPSLLMALRAKLPAPLRWAPIVIARMARVALADEVGSLLGARLAISLIGERPGLSSPDGLGAYLTYAPRIGRTDAERNCISNIRPEGLPCSEAAAQLADLIAAAFTAQASGLGIFANSSPAVVRIVDNKGHSSTPG